MIVDHSLPVIVNVVNQLYHHPTSLITRQFATTSDPNNNDDDGNKSEKKKDLRESIERMKKEGNSGQGSNNTTDTKEGDNNNATTGDESNPQLEKLTQMGTSFLTTLSSTWDELIASGNATDINKKIGSSSSSSEDDGGPNYENDNEAADKYEKYKGSKDVMVIDEGDDLSAWERMERRLRDAPIISGELLRYMWFMLFVVLIYRTPQFVNVSKSHLSL